MFWHGEVHTINLLFILTVILTKLFVLDYVMNFPTFEFAEVPIPP